MLRGSHMFLKGGIWVNYSFKNRNTMRYFKSRVWKKEISTNRQIWAVVFGDVRAVTLAEHCDLLLDVFNLILCLFQVNNLNGHHLFCAVVYSLIDLSKRAFTNSLQFGEVFLRIQTRILKGEKEWFKREWFKTSYQLSMARSSIVYFLYTGDGL